jgi:hypothetical protein
MSDDELLNKIYGKNAKEIKDIFQLLPVSSRPIITLQDVDNKFVERYFLQMVNDKSFIIEVNKTEFNNFKDNPRFLGVMIKWRIVGKQETITRPGNVVIYGTTDLNRNSVLQADLTMNGLRYYLKDYTQYWYAEQYE